MKNDLTLHKQKSSWAQKMLKMLKSPWARWGVRYGVSHLFRQQVWPLLKPTAEKLWDELSDFF